MYKTCLDIWYIGNAIVGINDIWQNCIFADLQIISLHWLVCQFDAWCLQTRQSIKGLSQLNKIVIWSIHFASIRTIVSFLAIDWTLNNFSIFYSKQMKLALVIYLTFCLSMVMTAPRPVGPTLVALPIVAGLPTLQFAGSAITAGTSLAGLKTLEAAGIIAANSNNRS